MQLDGGTLGFGTDVVVGTPGAMRLAECVTSGDERHGLVVVHRHAGERLADVASRSERVGIAVRPFGVDVDEAHLHGAEGVGELAVAAVAIVAEPGGLGTPVDVFFRCPDVFATPGEAERREAHRLDGDVAGEEQQVGPGDLPAVLLLDGQQQGPCLVEADIVGPAVEGREALGAGGAATATVFDAIGAGAVPRHPDEERAVVAVVGRPPVLRVGHQRSEILLQAGVVEGLELSGVVEVVAQRVGRRRVLMQHPQVQLVRPPVIVRGRPPGRVGGVGAVHHGTSLWAVIGVEGFLVAHYCSLQWCY